MVKHSVIVFGLLFLTCSATAQQLNVSSEVEGLRISILKQLPAAPEKSTPDDESDHCHAIQPATPEGSEVAKLGWKVTSEEVDGETTVVGFFSQGENGLSGSCNIKDGNIAVYRNGVLQALVYDKDVDDYSELGAVVKSTLKNTFKLESITAPRRVIAELYFDGKMARVKPLSPLEPYCDGTAPVPNVREQVIQKARKVLMGYGWIPLDGEPHEADNIAQRLYDEGVKEVDSCSGTGFGYCNFDYTREGGAGLSVITIGDDFMVSGYYVHCPNSQK